MWYNVLITNILLNYRDFLCLYKNYKLSRIGLRKLNDFSWCLARHILSSIVKICLNRTGSHENQCFSIPFIVDWYIQKIEIKLRSLFINVSQKTLNWPPYRLIYHCTSLSPWLFILHKNNVVKVSHHYITSEGYQVCL